MPINPADFFNMGVQASQRFQGLTQGLNESKNLLPHLLNYQVNQQKMTQTSALKQQEIGARSALEGFKQEQMNKRTTATNESRENVSQQKTKAYKDEQRANREAAQKRTETTVQGAKDRTQSTIQAQAPSRAATILDHLNRNPELLRQVQDHARTKFGLSQGTLGFFKGDPSPEQLIQAYSELLGAQQPTALGQGISGAGQVGAQGTIVVRSNITGQTIQIPADKFDPKRHTRV